jgi:hypothetical protein
VTIKPAVPATLVATLATERKPGSTSWSLSRDHCRCLADLVGRLLHFDVYVSRTHVESVESDSYSRLSLLPDFTHYNTFFLKSLLSFSIREQVRAPSVK